MFYALRHYRHPIACLILSAKGGRAAADVFNHGWALFIATEFGSVSSEAVEWALNTCMGEASPERPFGGLDLVWRDLFCSETLLHRCAKRGIVSPRIAQLLQHQLMER